jgi:hypothetical protein
VDIKSVTALSAPKYTWADLTALSSDDNSLGNLAQSHSSGYSSRPACRTVISTTQEKEKEGKEKLIVPQIFSPNQNNHKKEENKPLIVPQIFSTNQDNKKQKKKKKKMIIPQIFSL